MQLLQETFIIEDLQVLTEDKDHGVMKIKGVFGRCNEKNNNGRIYPTLVLKNQLDVVQPLIAERRLCGELDHPQNDTVKLANASHLVTKLEMHGDELLGEAEVLKTPAGLTAQALINGGVKIGISSRGMGTLSEDHKGDKVVNEDFRLITFDLVADPSTRGAYPGITESTQSKFARETQGKLQKEGNFVTMLQSKLRDAYQPWIEEAVASPQKEETKEEAVEIEESQTVNPAFERVKADGHWHRIAEIINVSLQEDLTSDIMKSSRQDDTEGIGIAAGERRRGFRGHQRSQLRTVRGHAKKMGKIATRQNVRNIGKVAKAEGKAGRTKAKYGVKASKYGAESDLIKGRGEGAAAAAKAIGQGDATRTAGQATGDAAALQAKGQGDATRTAATAKGDAADLQAKGDARAGLTTAKGAVDATRTTDIGAARAKGAVDRTRSSETADTQIHRQGIKDKAASIAAAKTAAEPAAKPTPGQEALADVQSGGPKTPRATSATAPADPHAAEKAARKKESEDANAALKARGASLRDTGNAPLVNPAVGPIGPSRIRTSTHYKQIGIMLAEAMGLYEEQPVPTRHRPPVTARPPLSDKEKALAAARRRTPSTGKVEKPNSDDGPQPSRKT